MFSLCTHQGSLHEYEYIQGHLNGSQEKMSLKEEAPTHQRLSIAQKKQKKEDETQRCSFHLIFFIQSPVLAH